MRLLNSLTWEIKLFISDEDIPPYAILSHTWQDEEVNFQDWQTLCFTAVESMKGCKKILYTCSQALRDGLEWVWIDTCCIDKSSSAELSQAINSMFRWYSNAAVCYVYLSDVAKSANPSTLEFEISRSRWFNRGWTLQELIAPPKLVFYSRDWENIGTKSSLHSLISQITGIEQGFLNFGQLSKASIAKKMSWAANRQTSRSEDIAYCLLGIFEVHMPLLYGEGRRAFQRLQTEITKTCPHDHTIFACGVIVDKLSLVVTDPDIRSGEKILSWEKQEVRKPLQGLLATSPKDFEHSSSFIPSLSSAQYYRSGKKPILLPTQVGKGIRLELPMREHCNSHLSTYHRTQGRITQLLRCYFVTLLCSNEDQNTRTIILPLFPWVNLSWGRTHELLIGSPLYTGEEARSKTWCYHIEPEQRTELENGDIIFRRRLWNHSIWDAGVYLARNTNLEYFEREQLFRVRSYGVSWANTFTLRKSKPLRGFSVLFGRAPCEKSSIGQVTIGFLPIVLNVSDSCVDLDGIKWYSLSKLFEDGLLPINCVETDSTDVWTLDLDPFPYIRVEVERRKLDRKGNAVNVLGIVITDKTEVPLLSRLQNCPSSNIQEKEMQFKAIRECTISQRVSKRRRIL